MRNSARVVTVGLKQGTALGDSLGVEGGGKESSKIRDLFVRSRYFFFFLLIIEFNVLGEHSTRAVEEVGGT